MTIPVEQPEVAAFDVWCAIPVYNNAPTIVDIARRSRAIVPNVIVVDDGSTDADLRELLKNLDIHVIRHPKNLGKGAALATAFKFAAERNAKYLITLDGDGQHYPEDIPLFSPHLQPHAILIGDRAQIIGSMPRSSRFGREFSDFWIYTETGHAARDTQCGFRAYPVAPVLELNLNSTGYHFEMEVITRGIWTGLTTKSIPIRVQYWEGKQRQSSFDPLLDNLKIARLHAHLIARQLIPVPHKKIIEREHGPLTSEEGWGEGTPLCLAFTALLGLFFGIAIWPIGPLFAVYLALRLHLNKIATVICLCLCVGVAFFGWSRQVGSFLFRGSFEIGKETFLAAHILAILIAVPCMFAVYFIARQIRLKYERANEHR